MKNYLFISKKIKLRNKFSLLTFELFYKAAFYVTVVLVFQWALKLTLRLSKFSYLTIENIKAYIRSPFTIICLVCILFLAGIFLLIEMSALIVFFNSAIRKQNVHVEQIMFPGIKSVGMFFRKKLNILIMPFFSILEGFFLMLPIIISVSTRFRIPNYVINAIVGKGHQVIYIAAVIICIIGYLGMFTLQYCLMEEKSFFEAFRLSIRLQKGHIFNILQTLLVRNSLLVVLFFVFYYFVLAVAGLLIYTFVDEQVIISVYLSVYDKINVISAIIFTMIGLLSNVSAITKLYIIYREEEGQKTGYEIEKMQEEIGIELDVPAIYAKNKPSIFYLGRYQIIIRLMFIFVAAFSIWYIMNWIRHGTFTSQYTILGIDITAHRGSSKDAPENTLEAIEKAIAEYADYAEIDVQETKDGVVILLHDDNVKRTTNGTGYIWDYSYYDLMQLDAGSWFSEEYAGVLIPTLDEVLEASKGRIFLNIEIKINSHNDDIVEKVVRLIEEYNFEQQCVISSANYAALAEVKELNQNIRTGYIMALAYGNFYDNEYADFYSIKSGFINENLVKLAHGFGKEVHAWTVNNKTEMERMKNLMVNNIITDYPLLAKEVIYSEENESLRSFLRLFINQ